MNPHGTSRYKHGCRCDNCRAANTAASRAYRRRLGVMPMGNPVEHDGTIYPSQKAAAAALGVTDVTIRAHLNRYGDLSRVKARAQHHGAQV